MGGAAAAGKVANGDVLGAVFRLDRLLLRAERRLVLGTSAKENIKTLRMRQLNFIKRIATAIPNQSHNRVEAVSLEVQFAMQSRQIIVS